MSKSFKCPDGSYIKAINNICLELEPGFYYLVGPNASGKTTLLRILSRKINPDNGSVFTINNENAFKIPMNRFYSEYVGYSNQEISEIIFPNLTVFEHILLSISRVSNKNKFPLTNSQLERLIKEFGFPEEILQKMTVKAKFLSGGFKQILRLLQEAINPRKLLLFDELDSSLDENNANLCVKILKKMAYKKELIVIFVTHNLKLLLSEPDMVIVLSKGAIKEIYAPPFSLENITKILLEV
jgi:putative ABC transport system ATP-binding protein